MRVRIEVVGLFLLLLFCSAASGQTLAIKAAKVYPSPDAKPLVNVTVLIRDGRIAAIGRDVAVPAGVKVLPCLHCVVCAGFWNTHVHFVEPKWFDAATLPSAQLTKQLQEMLTRWGFTMVVDTGSDPGNTTILRKRIEAGEVAGPHIYTAGLPLYPPHALPYYLNDLPQALVSQLPQPATPAEATAAVERNVAAGTDIAKLFTGSIVAPGHIVPMSLPEARAAVDAAHAHHQLVFTHATNFAGVDVALSAGVDVVAHTPEVTEGFSDGYLKKMIDKHMTIISTLKLFSQDSNIGEIRNLDYRFHAMGGRLMFGTDTGFLTDYDMQEEYRQLYLAGFKFPDVLAMLTSNPARLFGVQRVKGRVEVGMDGDLTVLADEPESQHSSLPEVQYTIRRGKVLYEKTD